MPSAPPTRSTAWAIAQPSRRTSGRYRAHFFDSHGNLTTHELAHDDGAWTWHCETTRCTATFSDDRETQTAHHELLDDAGWVPSMNVTLRKVE